MHRKNEHDMEADDSGVVGVVFIDGGFGVSLALKVRTLHIRRIIIGATVSFFPR